MIHSRRSARELALKALYQADVGKQPLPERNVAVQLETNSPPAPEQFAPTFEDSALFAEWHLRSSAEKAICRSGQLNLLCAFHLYIGGTGVQILFLADGQFALPSGVVVEAGGIHEGNP